VTYNACLNPAFTVKLLVNGMVINPSPMKLNSVTMVQSPMLDSKPLKLPTFVQTCVFVPFMTSIAIPVITILVFFATTSNMIPFRLKHLRFVELPTEFLIQEGVTKAGISGLYAVGVYEEVVMAVGDTEKDGCVVAALGSAVGLSVGCELGPFVGTLVGMVVGFVDVGYFVGCAVGAEVGLDEGLTVGFG
jgi:hypothetical protein